MRATWIIAMGVAVAASGAGATEVALASGHSVTLFDVIYEETPSVARFRFVSDKIGPDGLQFDDIAGDMQVLCDEIAIAQLAREARSPDQVVVSISDRIVPFGDISPDATQFFDAFRIEGARCMWEQF